MRVLVVGGSGLIGRALVTSLVEDAHQAVVLTRRPAEVRGLPPGVRAAGWDGRSLGAWVEEVAGADAIVQLAGESIFGRWTAAKKRRLASSRVASSRLLAEACAAVRRRPAVFVQGSAIGFHGDRGDEVVDETTPAGEGFLADLAVEWEAASAAVEALGIRRPVVRTGLVLARDGGALPLLRLAHLAFAGGPLGRGRQWVPWIHQADEVGAIRFLLEHPQATGPFELVAPEVVRNGELSRQLATLLRRPSWLPAPAFAVRLMLGELAESLLGGQRARPAALLALGYRFRFPGLAAALADLLPG
jgi:uncharacterized protein (TIGR01777 family)